MYPNSARARASGNAQNTAVSPPPISLTFLIFFFRADGSVGWKTSAMSETISIAAHFPLRFALFLLRDITLRLLAALVPPLDSGFL